MLMFYCLCFKYIYLCTKFNVKQKNLFMEKEKVKRRTVNISHNGSVVKLDVDRILAMDTFKQKLYFEFAVWDIEDKREFNMVWNIWLGYDE